MAKWDFRLWSHPLGEHGAIRYGKLASGQSFVAGEPVRLNTSGELVECSDATATGTDLAGIAAASGDIAGSTDGTGSFRFKLGSFTPGTGYPVAGDLVPYYVPSPETLFITANFDAATDGTLDTPVQTDVGDVCGIQLSSGVWSLSGATDPFLCRVMDVLDVNYMPIALSGGTGKFVVFTINAYQSASVAVVTDAS